MIAPSNPSDDINPARSMPALSAPFVEWAIWYATELGWMVFPIIPHSKKPLTEHGLNDASKDVAIIRNLWERWPNANIGIATGPGSGIVVLDVDPRHDGDTSISELEAIFGTRIFETVSCATGGGGRHFYYSYPTDTTIRNSAGIRPGLDVRGEGGYVIAPRSVHENRNLYIWRAGLAPGQTELMPAPSFLPKKTNAKKSSASNSIRTQIPEGKRNEELFREACSLRSRKLKTESVLAVIRDVNLKCCNPPLPDSEITEIVKNAFNYTPPATANENGDDPFTDTANADRFIAANSSNFRYVQAWKKWLHWTGKRWKVCGDDDAIAAARAVVQLLCTEMANIKDEKLQHAYVSFIRSTLDLRRRTAMVKLAKCDPALWIDIKELDRDPSLLNCNNGTIDLRTGILRPHDKDDFITKIVEVDYDPEANCAVWEQFLNVIIPNPNVRAFLQRAVGYSFTADQAEQALFFCYGLGANGKTTFLNLLRRLLGEHYSLNAAPELLLATRDRSHPTAQADLFGKRFVICTEIGAMRSFDEVLVKQLTGSDPIRARRMHEDFWQFDPNHHIWISANHKPNIRGTDEAIWRRFLLIPFTVTIPKEKRDSHLQQKLEAELPGILAWGVRGAVEWYKTGLSAPAEVLAATQQYREEMDELGGFLSQRIISDPGSSVKSADLYNEYKTYCIQNSDEPMTHRTLGVRLRERGYVSKKSNGYPTYRNIRIRTDADAPANDSEEETIQGRGDVQGRISDIFAIENSRVSENSGNTSRYVPTSPADDVTVDLTTNGNVTNENGASQEPENRDISNCLNALPPPVARCFSCFSNRFWRVPQALHWTCIHCHPPANPESDVVTVEL